MNNTQQKNEFTSIPKVPEVSVGSRDEPNLEAFNQRIDRLRKLPDAPTEGREAGFVSRLCTSGLRLNAWLCAWIMAATAFGGFAFGIIAALEAS